MAITIQNAKIVPYQQKDTLSKVIFGDVWSITIKLNTPHESGDEYILALDYERIVYPASHAVCAYSDNFTIWQEAQEQDLAMSVALDSSRLAKWLSELKKPTPIYVQICRIRGGVYETLLLDEILALPSFVNPEMYEDKNTPVGEKLEKKLDKPLDSGVEGQVLTLDSALQPIWADAGEAQIGNGILTINQNGVTKGTFSANQGTNASINLTGENNVIESVKFNGTPATITNKVAVISASIPTVNNAKITITQGGTSKGSFTLNQANAATIALDAGGSGGETPSNAKITITQGGTSKGAFTLNQASSATIAIDAQVQADWSITDSSAKAYIKNKPTIPTVNNGVLTITQNGVTKGTFSANQAANSSINLTGENNVIEGVTFNGSTATISNKTAVISATIPTVNNAKITITQGGVSKGAFTLNQSTAQTIALDAGGSGGGGSWDGTFPEVITSAATLTAEPAHSYYWEVGAQDATLSASTTSGVDYDVPIDISISGGTVTVSGVTRIGLLVDGCINRCVITRRYDDAILYVYAYEVLS